MRNAKGTYNSQFWYSEYMFYGGLGRNDQIPDPSILKIPDPPPEFVT